MRRGNELAHTFLIAGAIALLAFSIYALLRAQANRPTSLPAVDVAGGERGAPSERPRGSARGTGRIVGEVLFSGSPPPRMALKVGADPVCARSPPLDEQVLVKDGKLQNALVRISKHLPAETPPEAAIEVNQRGCVYRPRVQGAVAGQQLVVHNSDPTLHNVHGHLGSSSLFNWAQPPRSPPREIRLGPAGTVLKLTCDMHPWMASYIVVTDNRFFATTAEDGTFQISDLPAGEYELEAWHERYGVRSATVAVRVGEATRITFRYSP